MASADAAASLRAFNLAFLSAGVSAAENTGFFCISGTGVDCHEILPQRLQQKFHLQKRKLLGMQGAAAQQRTRQAGEAAAGSR